MSAGFLIKKKAVVSGGHVPEYTKLSKFYINCINSFSSVSKFKSD